MCSPEPDKARIMGPIVERDRPGADGIALAGQALPYHSSQSLL